MSIRKLSNFSPDIQVYSNYHYNDLQTTAYLLDCYIKLGLDLVTGFQQKLVRDYKIQFRPDMPPLSLFKAEDADENLFLPLQQSKIIEARSTKIFSCLLDLMRHQKSKHFFCDEGLKKNRGEVYFRTCGLLNACNIQKESIITFLTLTANKNIIEYYKEQLCKSEMIIVRNRCAAHNSNDSKNNKGIGQPTRFYREDNENIKFSYRRNMYTYYIPKLLEDWNKLLCMTLKECIDKLFTYDKKYISNIHYNKLFIIKGRLDSLVKFENKIMPEQLIFEWPTQKAKQGMLIHQECNNSEKVPFFSWEDFDFYF